MWLCIFTAFITSVEVHLVPPLTQVRHYIQGVQSKHTLRHKLYRFDIPISPALTRTVRGGSQSKCRFDPTPFPHGYVPNTSCKAGTIEKTYSSRPDHTAVVAMQARKWPTCFQGLYVQRFQVMSTPQLTILVVEPVSYMAKALA